MLVIPTESTNSPLLFRNLEISARLMYQSRNYRPRIFRKLGISMRQRYHFRMLRMRLYRKLEISVRLMYQSRNFRPRIFPKTWNINAPDVSFSQASYASFPTAGNISASDVSGPDASHAPSPEAGNSSNTPDDSLWNSQHLYDTPPSQTASPPTVVNMLDISGAQRNE